MKRYKSVYQEMNRGDSDIPLSPAVQKIINTFYLTRRKNDDRLFFEGSGTGSYNDDSYISRIIPDFKLIPNIATAYTWTGYSKKEMITMSYTEGDIHLIIHDNIRDAQNDIKRSIKFAKENY